MRQFFNIVFGGLTLTLLGVILFSSGNYLWKRVYPRIAGKPFTFNALAAAIIPQPGDGTVINGISRIIRFNAEQEEGESVVPSITTPSDESKPVTAKAYILQNLSTKELEEEKNSEVALPIASLTKLITAVVSRQSLDPDTKVSITRGIIDTYGNTGNLRVGETFRVQDLMYPLLMVSSNDAAEALAVHYGRKDFLNEMNEFVQSIGAYRTYFRDPSGLSPQNISTARDMAIILNWIRNNDPEILEITELKTKTVRNHTWINPTHFLNWSNYAGGKNGYTPEADRTGASLFVAGINNDLYAVVVLGSKSRDNDVMSLLGKIK